MAPGADPQTLLSVEDALAAVLARARPLGAEDVELANAAGRVLAEDALAAVDLPPFPSSAMDGYAVRAADLPALLPVTERVAAGRPAGRALASEEAFAIATGGAVPDGADAVVPIEDVEHRDDAVEIAAPVDAGTNVRPRGGDVRAGAVVVAKGTRLAAAQIGALAAAGVARPRCTVRPRVSVLATGTELRAPGDELRAGEVYEANGVMLAAALTAAGAVVTSVDVVADDPAAHRTAIKRGLEADVFVTSGGVSVGEHDLVREIERELGVEEIFWRVAVKPGKPISFGVREKTLVFGLPGNPVSSLVGFELFVRPALAALTGAADAEPQFRVGRLVTTVRRNAERDEFLRARSRLEGDDVVLEPVTGQESHMIARAASADALVHVARGDGEVVSGSTVRYLSLV